MVVVVVEEPTTGGTGAAAAGGMADGGDTAETPTEPIEPMGVDIMGVDIMGGDMGGIAIGGDIMGMEEAEVVTAGGGTGVAIVAVAVGGTTTVEVADRAIEEDIWAIAPAIAAPEPEDDMPMLFMGAV